jgi:hypothetical protein
LQHRLPDAELDAGSLPDENKLRHPPTTLVRSAADQPWLRLDGFIKPPQLAAEMESLRTGGESPSR